PLALYRHLILLKVRHQVVISGKALKKNSTQTTPTVPSTTTSEGGKKLATGSTNLLLIAIIVAAILLLLIIIDIACCIARHCGVAYLIWSSTCGRSSKDEMNVKDADVEEGSTEQRSQPDEETPLQVAASKPEVAGNGDSGNDVKASLMQNEQPTPANTPLDGAAEVNEAVKPEDVAIAVDNKASNVEQA
uniref:Uncharacterized protein n=1 Tax=Ciona savignyi TaxID=51511 RepID=H2ZFS7_CIOSA